MKKAYVIPSLTVVEIRYGNLLSVSAEPLLIELDDAEIEIDYGGIDLDGTLEPMQKVTI